MRKKEISLAPQDPFDKGVLGRLGAWVLSTGRYILVFVELIVIGAFLSRFWLDRENSDLSEQLRQQRAILESTQSFEEEFRLFQTRLQVAAKALEGRVNVLAPLEVIEKVLPSDVLLSGYSVSDRSHEEDVDFIEVTISTKVTSEAGLAEFIDGLLAHQGVKSVRVGTIEKERGDTQMVIQFMIKFDKLFLQEEGNG